MNEKQLHRCHLVDLVVTSCQKDGIIIWRLVNGLKELFLSVLILTKIEIQLSNHGL